jgi:hypothetical protein
VIQTELSPGKPLRVILWDQRIDLDRPVTIEARAGERKFGPAGAKVTPVSLDASIRRELQDLGYVRPPEQLVIASVVFSDVTDPVTLTEIRMFWNDGRRSHTDDFKP